MRLAEDRWTASNAGGLPAAYFTFLPKSPGSLFALSFRYPQLYSRVGFAHEYRPLAQEELHFVPERRWHKLGQTLDPEDFTDAQAIAAVARIIRGNFRLIDRLFTQVERVMKINEFSTIPDDVIEAARSTLVVGIS